MSLRHLGLERIELFQLHRIDPKVPLEDQVGELKALQDEGKIAPHRTVARSMSTELEQAARGWPTSPPSRTSTTWPTARPRRCWSTSRRGHRIHPVVPARHRRAGQAGRPARPNSRRRHGATPSQLALAWLLRRSPVMLPIPGTSSVAHLEDNIAAAQVELTDAEFDRVDGRGRLGSPAGRVARPGSAKSCEDDLVELRQFEYFVAVAEQLHFGRAAAALSIGQPAVSQQVARLERELGVDLFDRTGRTVRLTDAGRLLLPEARAVLAAVDRARSVLAPRAPILRIGSSTGLGDRLARVLQALSELAPGTETVLVSAPTRVRLERVAGGQLDAAFVRGVTAAADLELIEVWRDRLLVVLPATHELAAGDVVDLADLASIPLLIASRRDNAPLVDLVLGACADTGFTPKLGTHTGNLETTHAAIATGAPGWTVIYEAHARTLNQPRLAFRATSPELVMPTALAVRSDGTSHSLAPLLRACAAAADDL